MYSVFTMFNISHSKQFYFKKDPASVEELKMRLQTSEKEVHEMEKQLSGLHNDKWKRQMEYQFWEVDALKLLDLMQNLDASNVLRWTLTAEPLKKGLSVEDEQGDRQGDRRTLMMKLRDRIENQEDLFVILRSEVLENREKLIWLQDREVTLDKDRHKPSAFIEEKPKGFFSKALGSLRKKVTGIQKRKKYSGQKPKPPLMDSVPRASLVDYASVTPSMDSLKESVSETSLEDGESLSSQVSPEDLSLLVSSIRSGSQITTLEETHECSEDVEKITEDLDIVEKPLMDSVPRASLVDYASVTPSMDSEDLSLLVSSIRSGSQITTLEETHECFEDVEKITEDLDIVEKEKDNKIMQLSPLYTAEWQNTVRYLSRNIGSLSMFKEQRSRLDTTDYECHDHPLFGGSSEIPTDFPGTDIQRKQKQTSHVLQIRQFQQGKLGRTPLYAILGRMIAEDKVAIASMEGSLLSMEQGGRLVYVIGTPVLCPKLHLDAARANTMWCHVTSDGDLINSQSHTPSDQERHRLQVYRGTCTSTPIPLYPPHPLSPQDTAHLDTGRHSPGRVR
ncbi:uncharacterized protein LOC124273278 isoform X2 [Haliotis rubra]|uniref:uncharacterized protein LOC124273278 isoform X2 n=1 Tax=Haliotis rubra TaxID=36100 RepID=UPI001EE53BE6|nr:uncharacterized protein LOC124273278 isoform X2 [Haliotis rubra]